LRILLREAQLLGETVQSGRDIRVWAQTGEHERVLPRGPLGGRETLEWITAVNAGQGLVRYLFSALRTGDQGHKIPPLV